MNKPQINWDDYRKDIERLYCENGLGCDLIAKEMFTLFPNAPFGAFSTVSRAVRRSVSRWGLIRGQVESRPYEQSSPARVLVFDIETSPIRGYVWRLWKQNVANNQIISDWFVLTWSAKWLFEEGVMSDRLTSEEVIREDDSRIVRGLWELMEEADIVVAHNAIRFDIPMINTRFVIHGLHPPMPYEVIDTLRHAQKKWKMSSNRLDYLCKVLGLDRKVDTGGFELWNRCMQGQEDALEEMEKYNIQDVIILEELYLRMRSWIKPHPNMGLHITEDITSCPACGNSDLEWGGDYHTSVNIYEAFRCKCCGSQGRSRKATKISRDNLSASVAK